MSFVFYDTETTGTDTVFDQILQFAAIRTDEDLVELERFDIRCRLLPHVVPSPGAMRVTGVPREFKKYGVEASPAHVQELLDEIRKSARRLSRALARFQEMAARLSDGTAPLAGPHLSWLDEIIAQAMAGEITADVNEQRLAIVHFRRMDFLGRLTDVEVAARHAQKHLDSKLLRRARTSENRALRTLVAMARPVWLSLTGRKPSVNKVAGEQRSDFVTFVQELAKIAGGPEPTFKQVQSAFRVRTPD